MKFPAHFVLLFLSFTVISPVAAQRVFDNFDRSQGVSVYVPPPPVVQAVPQRRRGKNGKLEYATDGRKIQKIGQTRPTASVTDGLATREGQAIGTVSKLTMGSSTHLKGFTTGIEMHDAYIVESSRRHGIDPLLIYAQMHQESSFKIRATSHKGASGLMQLMPATARRFGVTSIYDPKQNIDAGVKYMRWLLDTFRGDVVLALAGYNAGEGAVMKYGWNVPPYRETQEYVRRITSRYNQISDGTYVQTARRISPQIAAKLEQNDARPLSIYEPAPIAVRTADGKMILVNQ
jgi:hypothetical protein